MPDQLENTSDILVTVTISIQELTSIIQKAVEDEIKKSFPSEWLTKQQLCEEFDIKNACLYSIENDPKHAFIYSTMGAKKHLYHRPDINAYLERRKRNVL